MNQDEEIEFLEDKIIHLQKEIADIKDDFQKKLQLIANDRKEEGSYYQRRYIPGKEVKAAFNQQHTVAHQQAVQQSASQQQQAQAANDIPGLFDIDPWDRQV